MKLNIFAGLLFALLLAVGVNTKADAQCCRWHRYYYHSCEHMCCNDKDKDKDKDKTEDASDKKDNDKECCHHEQSCCGYHCCHSWAYVPPAHHHCGDCDSHHSSCHHECHHHCDDYCGYGYYYRGGGW